MSEHTIYVSHTREASAAAERLTRELTAAGFSIARNTHTVQAGRRLKPALKESMTGAARVLACFSSRYGAPAEYETEEVTLAIEQSASRPEGELWLIPVKLTLCEIPSLQTPHGNLAERAAIDLSGDWAEGMARLLASLPLSPPVEPAPPETPTIATGGAQLDIRLEEAHSGNTRLVNANGPATPGAPTRTSFNVRKLTTDGDLEVTNQNNRR